MVPESLDRLREIDERFQGKATELLLQPGICVTNPMMMPVNHDKLIDISPSNLSSPAHLTNLDKKAGLLAVSSGWVTRR